jgi:methanogenic corrinoid protein MtbC1
VRTRVKVLIGGAPVTMQYAKEIGADGYSENAGGAVDLVRGLLAETK